MRDWGIVDVVTEFSTVSISDLRAALMTTLDLVEQLFGPEISVDVDYYWHLPVEDAFDMTREPTAFTAGQLSDDIAYAIKDRHERVPEEAWHDLSHLIGTLRALEWRTRP